MNKQEALNLFVKKNYKLLNEKEQFSRNKYNEIKKDYFGKVLKYKFGNPPDREICDCFVELLIKTERILDQATLEQVILHTPFLKLNNIKSENYTAIINSIIGKYAIIEEVAGIDGIEKIEKQLEWVKREKSKEIDELITQKKEEYLRLPSILDEADFPEPMEIPQQNRESEWWEDLKLKENPFPGPLDGFCFIDKSLYQQIIVETTPIKWALGKLEKESFDIFHRGFLLAGEFGTGKTTFYDFIAPHLTMKLIEPIRIALTENVSEAQYIQKFEKEVCVEILKLARRYNLRGTSHILDFEEARIHMLEVQKTIKGFLLFIDDLHKHTNLDLVFRFLSQLQIIKNNFSRDGINVIWMVAGFPSWRDKIKQDSSLTGFFDAADQLTLPEVTPALAAQAIEKRLRAFAINPHKELEVKQQFLASIFSKVKLERGISNIGFRPYIQEALQLFEQKKFNILSVDITALNKDILHEIKTTLESHMYFKKSIDQLVFGGGITKKDVRELTLRILCDIYLRNGITEDDPLFVSHHFSFKKLNLANLIRKTDRQKDGIHILVWNINPTLEDLNKEIIQKFNLSMEDYLVPAYIDVSQYTKVPIEKTKVQIYEEDLKKWQENLDITYVNAVQKAFNKYSNDIYPFTHNQSNKSYDVESLPSLKKIKEPVWIMMKTIMRYESPQLLDICGENNIQGWSLRHRSMQCSDYFISLLHNAEVDNVSVQDHTRLISFADEAFGELWSEFREIINLNQYSQVAYHMLPKDILQTIFSEYKTLVNPVTQKTEYFQSLDRFIDKLEQSIRQYLLVSSTLIFGPHHIRIKLYPEEIKKYISKTLSTSPTSYEAYNEFENLNRGQYRYLFQQSGKSSAFYRFIIEPLIGKWDIQDISSFLKIFGDMNIITSHLKSSSAENTRRDVITFFRLACRLIADMTQRLRALLLTENTILHDPNEKTQVVFGHLIKDYKGVTREIWGTQYEIPNSIYRHDISNEIKTDAFSEIMSCCDNIFGYVELDLLDIEGMRIEFSREYSMLVSLIAYYLFANKAIGRPLYGSSIWIKSST